MGHPNNKVVAFITDNGANIVKAVTNVYGKNKHMPCFAHTLNLVASKPFDNKDGLEEAKNLLTAVKDITTYFKHNTNAADSLKKAQDHQKRTFGLIQSVCTRWNFVFLSIRTVFNFYLLRSVVSRYMCIVLPNQNNRTCHRTRGRDDLNYYANSA